MKVKEESGKVGLKLNIQKTKIMASGPIISWQINEESVEKMTDFVFFFQGVPTPVLFKTQISIYLAVMANCSNNGEHESLTNTRL